MVDIIEYPDSGLKATRRTLRAADATPIDPIIALIIEEDRWRSLAVKAREKAEIDAFHNGGPNYSEGGPLFEEVHRLEGIAGELFDRIISTPAPTLAGILAKLEYGHC